MTPQRKRILLFANQLDPDAAAYFSRAGITNATQQAAINTYILGLKSAGLWDKIIARYITFNSSTTAGANLKSSSYAGTLSGVSPASAGASGYVGTTTSYFRTGIIASSVFSKNDIHYGFYRIAGSSDLNTYYGIDVSANRIVIRCTSTSTFANFYGQATTNYTAADKRLTYLVGTCVDSTSTGKKIYSNGTLLNSSIATDSGSLGAYELVFDGTNGGSFAPFGAANTYMLFTCGYGFSATDALNDYNLTAALKTALGL